ncbi:SCO family protein [Allohahella marinimesophila]|uniref:SCO family protein n=1 Tax=Allohahella marinimesophila TaxID=1054972 RepID=A0ABP7PF06_9GAMM
MPAFGWSESLKRLLPIAVFAMSAAAASAEGYEQLDTPRPLPEFTLQDQHEQAFGLADLKGQWSMIFVGFTSCPDVCPYTLAALEAVRAQLGLRLRPENLPDIVLLAVDPQRDKAHIKPYLAHFHPDYIGITGEAKEIDKLIEGIEGFYELKRTSPMDTGYDVVHSAAVSIIDPAGNVVARILPPFNAFRASEYLAGIIRGVQLGAR